MRHLRPGRTGVGLFEPRTTGVPLVRESPGGAKRTRLVYLL